MKKERFFRLLGDLDDVILDKYRRMDMRLSYKAMRKKRTLRVLAVAACLCLLIGACVPVGMMIAKWMEDRPVGPWPGPDPWGESGVEHGTDEPPQQDISVTIRSLEELEKMREMLECTDEQILDAYLQEVLSGRSKSKQELEKFVALVDGTAYAWLIDGELTYLNYQRGPSAGTGKLYEVLYVTVTAPNGEWIRCNYQLSWTDVEKTIDELVQNNADENLLSVPISTADGRLTLYVETRGPHPTYDGDFIQWWCVLDGQIVQIDYFVADEEMIDTAALLDRLKIADSIVPQFPGYAWANTKFGPFVQEPQLKNYGVLQENGVYGSMGWGQAQDYQDPDAPVTYIAPYPIANEVAALEYVTSMSQSLDRQAIHVYMARTDTAEYSVYVDAQTRECIGWQVEGEAFGVPYATEQEKLAATYQYLQEHVRDPEAYTPSVTEQDEYIYCRYSRYVGSFDSCDEVTALFDAQGYMVAVIGDYLGALRDMQEVPEALLNAVQVQLEEIRDTYADAVMKEITVKNLHIFTTGQILLDCSLTVRNQQSDESREYKYYAYLTEYVQ